MDAPGDRTSLVIDGHLAAGYLARLAARPIPPGRLEQKRAILRTHLLPFFEKMPLSAHAVELYKEARLRSGLAPKTINHHLAILRELVHFAVTSGNIVVPPIFRNLVVTPRPARSLNREQADRLLDCADPEHRPMILLALRAGLRLGELRNLRWENLDPEAGVVRVHGNAGPAAMRCIPLSAVTLAELDCQPRLGPWIFSDANGGRLTPGACKWPLYRAARRAGLGHLGWQVLRNTFARELSGRQVPASTIQSLLGCRSTNAVSRYTPVSEDAERRAILALDLKDVVGPPVHSWQFGPNSFVKGADAARHAGTLAGRQGLLNLFVFVPNDGWQRAHRGIPVLGVLGIAVRPRMSSRKSADENGPASSHVGGRTCHGLGHDQDGALSALGHPPNVAEGRGRTQASLSVVSSRLVFRPHVAR